MGGLIGASFNRFEFFVKLILMLYNVLKAYIYVQFKFKFISVALCEHYKQYQQVLRSFGNSNAYDCCLFYYARPLESMHAITNRHGRLE